MDRKSAAELMPVISSEITSGITVMRIALTHSVPIGAIESAARTSAGFPEIAIAIPAAIATATATSTSFVSRIYIIKSPPLMSSDAPVM